MFTRAIDIAISGYRQMRDEAKVASIEKDRQVSNGTADLVETGQGDFMGPAYRSFLLFESYVRLAKELEADDVTAIG